MLIFNPLSNKIFYYCINFILFSLHLSLFRRVVSPIKSTKARPTEHKKGHLNMRCPFDKG